MTSEFCTHQERGGEIPRRPPRETLSEGSGADTNREVGLFHTVQGRVKALAAGLCHRGRRGTDDTSSSLVPAASKAGAKNNMLLYIQIIRLLCAHCVRIITP